MLSFGSRRPLRIDMTSGKFWPILLKNSVLRYLMNSKEFFDYLARESQINCTVLSCVRRDFHATSATPPLVNTVRNAAQIANKIAVILKTEFFNRKDRVHRGLDGVPPNEQSEITDRRSPAWTITVGENTAVICAVPTVRQRVCLKKHYGASRPFC